MSNIKEETPRKNVFAGYFMQFSRYLLLSMPLLCMSLVIVKMSKLSCIEVTDKVYMIIACLAVVTYWIFKWDEATNK